MTDAEFLQQVKRRVHELDPQAEVWLFGSRARGDARPDSDWDFLVLTDRDLSHGKRWIFSDHLYDLILETGHQISTIVQAKQQMALFSVSDLYLNATEEGQLL